MLKMRVKNSEILNKNQGWNVTKNPLETMFVNDSGDFITGEWSEFHVRCTDHSEYYQVANKSVYTYVEPIIFGPENNTLILPDRVLNDKEKNAIHELVEMIDELNVDLYIEGKNEYSPALDVLLNAGASPLSVWDAFVNGYIVFIDDDEYNEYDEYEKESVFYTDDGNMFVVTV